MLVQAILHQEDLKKKYIEAVCDDHFKLYFGSLSRDFNFTLTDNDYWTIQKVSVDKNNIIIGYMTCSISRYSRVMSNFGLLNFTKVPNVTFAKDVLIFIRELRDIHNASKFEFSAYVGGEPEKMYRKFIKKYGGRVVGVYTASQTLTDGKIYDSAMFEIMRKDMCF